MKSVTLLKSQLSKKGGAEKYARRLASALHAKGHPVRVVTTGAPAEEFPFEVTYCPIRSKTSVSKVWEFESFVENELRAHPTDVVLGLDRNRHQTHLRASSGVHRTYLEKRALFEPRWKRLRHMLNPLHSTLLHIEKFGFEHPDLRCIFTNSQMVKEEILSHFVIDRPEKIHVIHNGVEWNDLQFSFDAWEEHKDKSRFEILFAGSDFARKGLAPLLRGLSRLKEQDLHLAIVGKDRNEKSYRALAKRLGVESQVTFFGEQESLRPFLQRADCLALPTHYDPFANVTLEALAMGLFVLTSKGNGAHEILTPDSGLALSNLEEGMESGLKIALSRPKTPSRATMIRESVQHLDFSRQLGGYLEKLECL